MTGPQDALLTLTAIGRRAGVGRVAVATWRRLHEDFPPAVGGSEQSPHFDADQVDAWLRLHGKVSDDDEAPPTPPARIDFGDGRVVTMRAPRLADHGDRRELGGYVDPDVSVPWPTATVRVEMTNAEPFEVADAQIDLKSYGQPWRYLRLSWRTAARTAADPEGSISPARP
ncbi:hypothetical protein [Kitasatospora sp. NPDC002965]|uniref:hypothetical protein n=1 Tax=Kitasatospora sp. NPDC002965 TaxID=3154775 RepID=UPI0033A1AB9D